MRGKLTLISPSHSPSPLPLGEEYKIKFLLQCTSTVLPKLCLEEHSTVPVPLMTNISKIKVTRY